MNKWILMVLAGVITFGILGCTTAPTTPVSPQPVPVPSSGEIIAKSENFTLLAPEAAPTITATEEITTPVDFGGGYAPAVLHEGEVIAQLRCEGYVIEFSSFKVEDQGHAITPDDCVGLESLQGIEIAVASSTDQMYYPECQVTQCFLGPKAVFNEWLRDDLHLVFWRVALPTDGKLVLLLK